MILSKKLKPLEYVQLITRSGLHSKEPKPWYPDTEPSLMFFSIPNKAMLIKYMLHAKHRRIDSTQNEKLESAIGEDF